MPRDVYSSDEIRLIEQAIDRVLRDGPPAKAPSDRAREQLAAAAFRVVRQQDTIKLEPLIAALRTHIASAT